MLKFKICAATVAFVCAGGTSASAVERYDMINVSESLQLAADNRIEVLAYTHYSAGDRRIHSMLFTFDGYKTEITETRPSNGVAGLAFRIDGPRTRDLVWVYDTNSDGLADGGWSRAHGSEMWQRHLDHAVELLYRYEDSL